MIYRFNWIKKDIRGGSPIVRIFASKTIDVSASLAYPVIYFILLFFLIKGRLKILSSKKKLLYRFFSSNRGSATLIFCLFIIAGDAEILFTYENLSFFMVNIIYWEPILWSTPFLYNFSSFFEVINILQMCLLGYIIFFFGIIGLVIRRISIIYILISIELMFLGLDIVFLFIGFLLYLPFLQVIVLLLLVLAACEAAIILSIIYNFYKLNKTTDVAILTLLRF